MDMKLQHMKKQKMYTINKMVGNTIRNLLKKVNSYKCATSMELLSITKKYFSTISADEVCMQWFKKHNKTKD